ncbi:hypothetical protein QJQ45_021148 [Haematococcus lacustris]|nr:hypothetical protein QJQ45_021148 [Haematococcus lacustris]
MLATFADVQRGTAAQLYCTPLIRSSHTFAGTRSRFSKSKVQLSQEVLYRVCVCACMQRLIRGASFGLQVFAVNRSHGLLAVADKGPRPEILVYSTHNVQLLAAITLGYHLGYSALAFSEDGERLLICGEEPDNKIVVYQWRQKLVLASGTPAHGFGTVRQASFHPYDHDRLAVTGASSTAVWRLERLWDHLTFTSHPVSLGLPGGLGQHTTCHCWWLGGLYLGTSQGRVYCLPISTTTGSSSSSLAEGVLSPGAPNPEHPMPAAPADPAPPPGPDVAVAGPKQPGSGSGLAAMLPAFADIGKGVPITALSVNRDLLAVGGSEVVAWFLHPPLPASPALATPPALQLAMEVDMQDATAQQLPGSFLQPEQQLRLFCVHKLGVGVGVLGLDVGGLEHCTWAVGTSDSRVLLLQTAPLAASQPLLPASLRSVLQGADAGLPKASAEAAATAAEQARGVLAGDVLGRSVPAGWGGEWTEGAALEPEAQQPAGEPPAEQVLVDAHVGPVTAMVPHPLGYGLLSCGLDGTLRVWAVDSLLRLVAKRAFPSALTSLATAPLSSPCGGLMAVVGSELGVIRLVSLAPPTVGDVGSDAGTAASSLVGGVVTPSLQVTWRRRLHTGSLHAVAFSPDGSMLATAGADKCIWFMSVNRDRTCMVLGHVRSPDVILTMVWPEVQETEDCVLASLASGGVLAASVPVELHAASRPTAGMDLTLTNKEVTVKVVKLETALLCCVAVPGQRYGELLGLGADKLLHRVRPRVCSSCPAAALPQVVLPLESQAWAGIKGRLHKSTAHSAVHARPEGVLALSPSHQLLVTGSSDGTIATHTPSLTLVGSLGPSSSSPRGVGSPPSPPAPETRTSASVRAPGVVMPPDLAAITQPGNAVTVAVSQEPQGLMRLAGGLAAWSGGAAAGLHQLAAGGVAAVGFDHSGRFIISAGSDGSLFVYETKGGHHLTRKPSTKMFNPNQKHGGLAVPDQDLMDSPDEPHEVLLHRSRQAAAVSPQPAPAPGAAPFSRMMLPGEGDAGAMVARLAELRELLQRCVVDNANAPELEKIGRSDFLIDQGLLQELKDQADQRVAALREHLQQEQLQLEVQGGMGPGRSHAAVCCFCQVIAERVKHACWDSQLIKGRRVTAMRALGWQVANMPFTQDPARLRVLAKVSFLRRVELVEQQQHQRGIAAQATAQSAAQHATAEFATAAPAVTGGASSKPALPSPPLYPTPPPSQPPGTASTVMSRSHSMIPLDNHMEEEGDIHASPTNQICDTKARFNEEWERVRQLKLAETDKIGDLCARLDEITRDLHKLGASPLPGTDSKFVVAFPEDMSGVFTVKDEEVQLDRVLAQQGQTESDSSSPGQQQASNDPGAAERALKAMMGGSLAPRDMDAQVGHMPTCKLIRSKAKHRIDDYLRWGEYGQLVKPAWMEGNPKLFTEEQLKELRIFQGQEKQLAEEKAKRVSTLEQEMRTVKAAMDDLITRFDEAVQAAAGRHAATQAAVCAAESRILGLAQATDACLACSDAHEQDVFARLAVTKDAHLRASMELAEKHAFHTQVEAHLQEQLAEQKAMDKNFKKEFADAEPFYSKILHLYRSRFANSSLVAASTSEMPAERPRNSRQLSHINSNSRQSDIAGSEQLQAAGGSRQHRPGHHGSSPGPSDPALRSTQLAGSSAAPSPSAPTASLQGGGPGAMGPAHPSSVTQTVSTFIGAAGVLPPGLALGLEGEKGAGIDGHEGDPLMAVLAQNSMAALQASTLSAWPTLPISLATLLPSTTRLPGQLPTGFSEEGPLDPNLAPEGLEPEVWRRLQDYRGRRVASEVEVRQQLGCLVMLRKELPALEAREAAAAAASQSAMSDMQALRAARRAALFDLELQLSLKAGQVETSPAAVVSSDMRHALLLHRSVVEGRNGVVRSKGARNVGILQAIKEFRKGCHQLDWEHKRCDMLLAELRERVRELQLLHVTRDMQAVFRQDGSPQAAAPVVNETAALEALAKQRERLHRKAMTERGKSLKQIGQQISDKAGQNMEVNHHVVGLQRVLEEQQRLRASMGAADEAIDRRLKSLVTHKKLKEIALAQADEVRALSSELDRLRLKTYPTFLEPTSSLFPADIRMPLSSPSTNSPGALGQRRGFQGISPRSSPTNLLPLNRSHPHLTLDPAAMGSPGR